ncbi:MAG TPA: OsmC family protein [Candidatus Acidoferrales bacterium]
MKISARIDNKKGAHAISLRSGENEHSLMVAPKAEGFGSSVNGGEMLFLALATCYCNDIYREAKKRGMAVERVEVEVSGEFGGEGEAARNISYRAVVAASAPRAEILELMRHTDSVAEIQNTLRKGLPVVLAQCEASEA